MTAPRRSAAVAALVAATLLAGVAVLVAWRLTTPASEPSPPPVATSYRPVGGGPVVTVAGDIGVDGPEDEATAALVRQVDPDVALTVGDHAYPDGTASDYAERYTPDWGTFRERTRPAPGNHDYHEESGDPSHYFTYFADRLPEAHGGRYYAFDLGAWRLYSLNCEIDCSPTSPQVAWLRHDLATRGTGTNALAYLHRPRYSCGEHGSSTTPSGLWDVLLEARADVVVAGHDHNYQRFPRMDASGDAHRGGLVSFVAGTGGAELYEFGTGEEGCPLARYRQNAHHGVLVLTLRARAFSWQFVATDGTVLDAGTTATLGGGPRSSHP